MIICPFHGITKQTVCEAVGNERGKLQFLDPCCPTEMTSQNEHIWRSMHKQLLNAAQRDERKLHSVPDDPGKFVSKDRSTK